MAERRLTPEEDALWRRVMATVRPARAMMQRQVSTAPPPEPNKLGSLTGIDGRLPSTGQVSRRPPTNPAFTTTAAPRPGKTLDGTWDRKLATGTAIPDSAIDLHGHTLQSAYDVLDQGLARAIAQGDRLLLLVTGKPPRPESERPHARGRIRDTVDAWLAASRHAANIAAVRPAHPRHGGAGALYIILRRHPRERKY